MTELVGGDRTYSSSRLPAEVGAGFLGCNQSVNQVSVFLFQDLGIHLANLLLTDSVKWLGLDLSSLASFSLAALPPECLDKAQGTSYLSDCAFENIQSQCKTAIGNSNSGL